MREGDGCGCMWFGRCWLVSPYFYFGPQEIILNLQKVHGMSHDWLHDCAVVPKCIHGQPTSLQVVTKREPIHFKVPIATSMRI